MSTVTAPQKSPTRRRFTVDEYYRMADTGVLPEEENVELLDGQIYLMSPIGAEHASCVDRLNRLFVLGVGDEAIVRVQNPIRLSDTSEPEPDLALLAPRDDNYAARHPGPDDAFLIVEVADRSLDFDLETKRPVYARAGIPEYWVVSLKDEQVHVFRTPEEKQYTTHDVNGQGDELSVAALPALDPIPVAETVGE